MQVADDWVDIALSITKGFESSGDPWSAVSGDFDGMGISCGALQWNIGSASLQPLVIAVGEAAVLQFMPIFGAELWRACSGPIAAGLTIVRGWQDGARLRPGPKAELMALFGSVAMRPVQRAAIGRTANNALQQADRWATDRAGKPPTLHEFCWFFDLVTQNGDLKGLTYADVKALVDQAGAEAVDDIVCNWLSGRQDGVDAGWKDSRDNAALWRNQVPAASLDLFVLSYLRALLARAKYRGDTLNRKGTIAVMRGKVHGALFDLTAKLR